ncbi:site-specific DNA-methyltransferase [uncultured Paracoccus sp.]|uniref:DNA-methyltransferase n=1 Tax=uncultured Paracoccus sp. TaxID=189685 RepID=UPI00260EA0F6|nr:site-specific DNA-methyltransferase [uncultured Paracoccus sp.]
MNQIVGTLSGTHVLEKMTGSFQAGAAADVMRLLPDSCIDLIVTSPPYWTAVEYDGESTEWATYEAYLDDMQRVWNECARVLRPNGKLCINAPIMPIPKAVIEQHTRHLKNIAFDLEARILAGTDLERYSLFVWQKQTSKMMFGSYPQPGNILENNTIEFINVYVKPGKPPKFSDKVKEANKLSRTEWMDLAQQVWFMYPEDVKREEGHPAPFPEKLPARLIRLYTNGATESFPGEIVLDPFVGTGTTCVVAERMGRRWIGIDVSERYLDYARRRMRRLDPAAPLLLVGRGKYPSKDELMALAAEEAGTSGAQAAAKHRRKTYGRGASDRDDGQLLLV